MAVEKNLTWKKVSGRNFIFPLIFRLLGRISSGKEGKTTEIMGKKIKIKKQIGGEECKVVGNFINPCIKL